MGTVRKSTTKKSTTKARTWTTINLEIVGAANGYIVKEDQINDVDEFRVLRTIFASTDALLVALDKSLRDLRDHAQNGEFE